MSIIEDAVGHLGFVASDKITGYTGTITTVAFDVSGCIQFALTPEVRDGVVSAGHFFDVGHVEVDPDKPPKLPVPDFESYAAAPAADPAPPPPSVQAHAKGPQRKGARSRTTVTL